MSIDISGHHWHGGYRYDDDCPICAEVMRQDTEWMLLRLLERETPKGEL